MHVEFLFIDFLEGLLVSTKVMMVNNRPVMAKYVMGRTTIFPSRYLCPYLALEVVCFIKISFFLVSVNKWTNHEQNHVHFEV